MDIPLAAIQRQIVSAIDVVVHIGRLRDKSRKVLEVTEVLACSENEIKTKVLYEFLECKTESEQVEGEWKKIHEITNKAKLFSAGY